MTYHVFVVSTFDSSTIKKTYFYKCPYVFYHIVKSLPELNV